jgi:hypothetical protein
MFARIIQGYAESERIVTCAAQHPSVRLTFKVAECNSYKDKRLATYLEMSRIAWDVRPRSTGRGAGFVSAPGKEESDPVKAKRLPQKATASEGK